MWSLAALVIGFCIDLLVGDPHSFPHPVVLIGKCISVLERVLRCVCPKTPSGERAAGAILWGAVVIISTAVPALLLWLCGLVSPWLRLALESVMCWQILAVKSLRDETMKVYDALESGDLAASRRAVSMIVGRDTDRLDDAAVTRAAVETVAENTSDGVVAPLLFLAIGGAPLGFFYKAVNTMDSMLGYVEPPYKNIGLVPAKADDVVNYIPARLSALLMLAAGGLMGPDLPPRPPEARQSQLSPDGIRLRGAAGRASGGGCMVPRRAAQKGVYRRRSAGDHPRGHPPCVSPDDRHSASHPAFELRGQAALCAVKET